MTALAALSRTEARLLSREWTALVFAFVFPPVTLLVLAGSFGDQPDEGFGNVVPADFYVTGYLGIPLAALALIGLPVVLAWYRERGVLRRFAAFSVTTSAVAMAQALVTAAMVGVAAGTVLAVAAPTYGVPRVDDPVGVVAGFATGTVTMLVLGVALGLAMTTARGAQAMGLLAFFPMFLLSGGGPAPGRDVRRHAEDRRRAAPHPRCLRHPGAMARHRRDRRPPGSARRLARRGAGRRGQTASATV